jgi:hypothetical protein
MKTIETIVYSFNELDEKAKLKAIEKHRYFYVGEPWWDNVYESAEETGVKITGFDLEDRSKHINGKFIKDAESVADYILKEFGETCQAYKVADNYQKQRENTLEKAEKDNFGDFTDLYTLDNELDALDTELRNDLLNYYLKCLELEYEYYMSDEFISEFLINNEYNFLQDGTRF